MEFKDVFNSNIIREEIVKLIISEKFNFAIKTSIKSLYSKDKLKLWNFAKISTDH